MKLCINTERYTISTQTVGLLRYYINRVSKFTKLTPTTQSALLGQLTVINNLPNYFGVENGGLQLTECLFGFVTLYFGIKNNERTKGCPCFKY